jgi:DNA-binding winged helix-turn-helix (wHTH) protein/TolB-like protein/Flp pilus assembly protein TadD
VKVQQEERLVLEVNLGYTLINSWVDKLSKQKVYEFDNFRLDASHRILSRNGKDIELAPKAVETLLALVERRGEVISKDELLDAVWPDTNVEESNLFSYLSHLRKALGNRKDGKPYLETLRRRGYRFNGDARVVHPESYGESYARVIDNSDEDGAGVETQSGRFYILKEWDRSKSVKGRAQAALQPRPAEFSDPPMDEDTPPSLARDHEPVPELNQRRNLMAAILLGTVILTSLGFYLWRANSQPAPGPITTIAVLPFKPLVIENRNEWLEMGIADELIRKLSGADRLAVTSLPTVRRFATLEQDPQEAGRQLGVEFIVHGTIQIVDNTIRISPRLTRVSDGKQLWDDAYTQPKGDIIRLQNSISESIAAALKVPLGVVKDYTENVEAYRRYRMGELYRSRMSLSNAGKSILWYEEAIKLDQNYTLAYVGLAQSYRSLILSGDQDPLENIPKGKAAASRAVELDPNLADAHIVLGNSYFWYERDWSSAEQEYLKAIDLDSKNALAHLSYAHLLSNLGRHQEAIDEIQKSLDLEPTNLYSMMIQGQILTFAGHYDDALQALNRVIAIDPNLWAAHLFLCRVYAQKGMHDDAIKEGERAKKLNEGYAEATSMIAYSMARSGNPDGARRILSEMEDRAKTLYVPAYTIANIYNALGDKEKALTMLELSFEKKDALMVFLKVEPKWNNLRSEPRFLELMKKMNFND